VKIGIVHESRAVTKALELTIRQTRHQLEWTETNARRVMDAPHARWPDLVILDGGMRSPSSSELTRFVLAGGARGVLLAVANGAATADAYDAMANGALDIAKCPSLDARGALFQHEPLLLKLRTIARLLGEPSAQLTAPDLGGARLSARHPTIVAIGTSTGGPQALHRILSALPEDLNASYVIVQHLDSSLATDFASWLQQSTALRVVLAKSGCLPQPGTVLIAGSDAHLVMTAGGAYRYMEEPRELVHRPSIDVLFTSLAQHSASPGIAVLLTGMGRDGAQGLKRLRIAGWHTLAQDESTCVVYGMPKAAVELDAVDRVLALSDVAAAIARACAGR
jgi:two-component system response regulator WspF